MARAQWAVPVALGKQLTLEGKPVPAPVAGFMLIDTGASTTCIATAAADQLGLKPVDTCINHGAHGAQTSFLYFAHFTLGIGDGSGAALHRAWEMRALGVPGLMERFASFPMPPGVPALKVIGLIGRDFLKHCRMIYDGPAGGYELEVELNTIVGGAAGALTAGAFKIPTS